MSGEDSDRLIELRALLEELSRPADLPPMPRRVELCRRALSLVPREENQRLWAGLTGELGNTLLQSPQGPRAENLEEAIGCYREALEVFRPGSLPDDCRRAARNLGNLCFGEGRWPEAAEAYGTAREAADVLYQASVSRGGKEAELAAGGDLCQRAAYSLARLDRSEEAVLWLERARARGMSEALARDRAELARVDELDPEAAAAFRQAADRLRQFQSAELEGPPDKEQEESQRDRLAALHRHAEAAQEEFEQAITRIRRLAGHEGFLAPVGPKEIAAAAEVATPVYLVTTSQGSRALIVRPSAGPGDFQAIAVEADTFRQDDLAGLLVTSENDKVTGGYLPAQLHWTDAPTEDALTHELETLLPAVGEKLMGPLPIGCVIWARNTWC